MKRVFIIHGWTTTNQQDWIPWAVKETTKKGYTVIAPLMPDTNYPMIEAWVQKMAEVVGVVQPTDIFIGHSLGCQAILRYLETQPEHTKFDKLILVAGAQHLSREALPLPEDEGIFAPWRNTPINFEKIRKMAKKVVALFSNDDPWVLFEDNAPIYKEKLGAEIVLLKNKGHFMEENGGIIQIPEILQYL